MRRSWKHFLAIAIVILLMVPLTWFWGTTGGPDSGPSVRMERIQAIQQIERSFDDIQAEIIAFAGQVENIPEILLSLRQTTAGDFLDELSSGQKEVIRAFNRLPIPDNVALELYNVSFNLLAWRGFVLPPSRTRLQGNFPSNPEFNTVRDEDGVIKAIAYWHPLREGNTVIGAMRILYLVNVPRTESGFEAFSLVDKWQDQTGLLVNASWLEQNETGPATADLYLRSQWGDSLAAVTVREPVRSEQQEDQIARMWNIIAFWITLLLVWFLMGIVSWYTRISRADLRMSGFFIPRLRAFIVMVASMIAIRYFLHALDVPGRWLQETEYISNLFRADDLGSEIGGGIFRSVGEFFISGVMALLAAISWIHFLAKDRRWNCQCDTTIRTVLFAAGVGLLTFLLAEMVQLHAYLVHRVVEDSTLEYLRWSGLQPEFPVLVVYCGLLLFTVAFLLVGVGLVRIFGWLVSTVSPNSTWLRNVLGGFVAIVVLWLIATSWPYYLTFSAGVLFVFGIILGYLYSLTHEVTEWRIWTMRRLLFVLMVSTVLLYPVFFHVSHEKGKEEMVNVAEEFVYRKDEDVLFAITRILDNASQDPPVELEGNVARTDTTELLSAVNSLLNELNGLELGGFEASLWIVNPDETIATRLRRGGPAGHRTSMSQQSEVEKFGLIEDLGAAPAPALVRPVTEQGMQTRFLYEGAVPLYQDSTLHLGWMVARAEQRFGEVEDYSFLTSETGRTWQQRLSVAEFQQENLVRSQGHSFGRTRLPEDISDRLRRELAIWTDEQVYDSDYYTYYKRLTDVEGKQTVVAVRAQAVIPYDHLYYVLRFAVSGLWILLPFYLFGIWRRRKAGMLPAPRIEFRDKVLNGFLAVGVISVTAMGLIGEQVLTRGDEEAVQTRLDRRLERFQEAITLELPIGVLPYREIESILVRNQLDSLARVLSLELNVYEGADLVATTRPEYSERRWIERRMSIPVFEKVYLENYRTVYETLEETVDEYPFTVGYRAFPDERGNPRYVVAILTTPEQQRIREESARTAAYLFGSLLLLLMIFMGTATFLSSALARPLLRLRDGLRAVAAGRYGDRLPVRTRDEVGELVESFNEMQQQIQESRNRLAQQERQLAWNEMARQVAHEIKNPLTPMKLSVQHLQRAWGQLDAEDPESRGRFSELFSKITSTLSEQINALARIANEFASFARMPRRNLEVLDLNEIILETTRFLQTEDGIEIETHVADEPLVIRADREEMQRIFINLMKNGMQAMPDGGCLSLRTERYTDTRNLEWVHAYVQDNGTGIPRELRDKIFQPNFSTKTSGMGLGLAIIQKSILDLGGMIEFETEENKGTTFRITLPIIPLNATT